MKKTLYLPVVCKGTKDCINNQSFSVAEIVINNPFKIMFGVLEQPEDLD